MSLSISTSSFPPRPKSSSFFGTGVGGSESVLSMGGGKSRNTPSTGEGSGVRSGASAHVVVVTSGGGGERIEVPMMIVGEPLEAGDRERGGRQGGGGDAEEEEEGKEERGETLVVEEEGKGRLS